MQFHKVEYFLSAPRTARFLAATGGDQTLQRFNSSLGGLNRALGPDEQAIFF